jgi:hypothetical protein
MTGRYNRSFFSSPATPSSHRKTLFYLSFFSTLTAKTTNCFLLFDFIHINYLYKNKHNKELTKKSLGGTTGLVVFPSVYLLIIKKTCATSHLLMMTTRKRYLIINFFSPVRRSSNKVFNFLHIIKIVLGGKNRYRSFSPAFEISLLLNLLHLPVLSCSTFFK